MAAPMVLSLPLTEAVQRLEQAGYSYQCEVLLPPRAKAEDFADREMRKYVVRQKELSDNKIVLTIVYR